MEDHPHIPRPLVFLDYPISSITFEAELDLLRIQLRPCASEPRPCFQYSLLVVIPHGTCWPRARLLPAAKPRRSMDGKMSVGGTGVVHFLGIFCEIELKSNSDISN